MALSPIASTEQLLLLVRNHLLENQALTDIVGPEIRGVQYQDADNITVKYPRVALQMEGGYTVASSTYQSVTMFLYAYSRDSRGDAQKIYDIVHAALQQQLLRRDGISLAGYCMENARPDFGWSARPRAYFARGLWTVRAAHRST